MIPASLIKLHIKKGSVRTTNSIAINYNEQAPQINPADNININSDNNILIQSGNLNAGNNQTLEAGNNIAIQNDNLTNYSFNHTSRSYHGAAKVGANITSATIELLIWV